MRKAASLFFCLFTAMSLALAGGPPSVHEPASAPRPEDRGNEPPVIVITFNPKIVEPANQGGGQPGGSDIGMGPGNFDTGTAPVRGELYVRLVIRPSGSYFYIDCSTLPGDAQSVEMVNRTTGERTGVYSVGSGSMIIPAFNPYGQWEIFTVTATGIYYTASIRVN